MLDDIITAVPLGVLLSFLIGPVFFVLLETSAVKGFRAALVFDLGVIFADLFFILVAYFSSYRLIESIKDDPALFIFGGLIMLTYGIISFVKLRKVTPVNDSKVEIVIEKKNYLNLFVKGFLLNFINVGVLGFWLMVIITIGPKVSLDSSRMITFFTTVLLTYLVIDIGKIILAKQLRNKLTTNNINKVKKATSIVLMVFGVLIISQGWFPSEKKLVKSALQKIEYKDR